MQLYPIFYTVNAIITGVSARDEIGVGWGGLWLGAHLPCGSWLCTEALK
jgi:hypothetical protein